MKGEVQLSHSNVSSTENPQNICGRTFQAKCIRFLKVKGG